VLAATRFAHWTLRAGGKPDPRIAVAGLNPHAGDGGVFGREEIEVIAPAVARLRRADRCLRPVSRPHRVRAHQGRGVRRDRHHVSRPGPDRDEPHGLRGGITILAGLPVPVTTPARSTSPALAPPKSTRSAKPI
jgi:4-hydroxythreonine-4-phosphate dehydrogenase